MNTRTQAALVLAAALIAAVAMANESSAAPPSATLGVIKNHGMMINPGLVAKKKPSGSLSIGGIHKPNLVPGIGNLIPAPNLKPMPQPKPPLVPAPKPPAPKPPAPKPPSGPDWTDVLNGIGGILGPGGHGSGHHPGHHPGHYPGHQPGYVPGYPNPNHGGSSYVPSNPLPEIPADPRMAVVVSNPEKNGATISFVARGRRYHLAPGYQQVVARSGSVEVRFDRGGPFGTARFTLREGVFQFLVTDEGWNLFRKIYRVTLDNSENPFEFRYLIGNTIHVVEPNGIRDYEEHTPLVVTFDPGTGQAAVRSLDSGTYRIAINPELQLWDLHEVDVDADMPDIASNLPPSPPMPLGM